jgi:hypothetical protein
MVDAITYAIGEAASYVVGIFLGRAFRLEPKRAQRIGALVVLALLAGVLIALTVIYS